MPYYTVYQISIAWHNRTTSRFPTLMTVTVEYWRSSCNRNHTSSFARFARSATSPWFACMRNPAPDSCCSLMASASTASSPIALIRFNCCSPIASALAAARHLHPIQLLFPDCVRFGCCSPIVSASTAAPRLRLL